MRVDVFTRGELDDRLPAAERRELHLLGFEGRRAAEWVAGRAAAHRVLGMVDVLAESDGAPRVAGGAGGASGALSLSHDDEWVAVATAPSGRVAVDLCSRANRDQAAQVLRRLDVFGDPCLAWAALECALKLRRRGVMTLLGDGPAEPRGHIVVEAQGAGATVRGIGADVHVSWRSCDGYALAWAHEVEAQPVVAVERRPAVKAAARSLALRAARAHRARLA
ncbi:MAG TPA: hypothetical protein VMZ53_06820 [Kofleriaceae bacterium]|nr:hypothetical protein [Kofleriaceae bacterium]